MYVGHIAAYRRTRSPGRLAWSEGRRPFGAGLRTSDEPGELSKWLSRDDSTINIVIRISIIIIIIIIIISQDTKLHSQYHSLCHFPRFYLWRTSHFLWSAICTIQILLFSHSWTLLYPPLSWFQKASTIATSIVHSKLDYCNSLYYNLPYSQLNRL